MKTRVGDGVDVLYYMDDLKESTSDIKIVHSVHDIMKRYSASVGMVINTKKSPTQLRIEQPLPESLQEIPRLDEMTYKHLVFEAKRAKLT